MEEFIGSADPIQLLAVIGIAIVGLSLVKRALSIAITLVIVAFIGLVLILSGTMDRFIPNASDKAASVIIDAGENYIHSTTESIISNFDISTIP